MVERIDCRRRRLVALAAGTGILSAVPAVAGPRRQASPAPAKNANSTTDAAKVPVTATERLMRDQGIAARVLLVYAAGARRLGQGEDLDAGLLAQAAEVMRDFIHDHHEKAMAEEVFPRFLKAGRLVELVKVLNIQQSAGRGLTGRILAAAASASSNAAQRNELTDAMQASITLYRPHGAREVTDLFPALRPIVTPSEFEDMGKALEKRESETFGPGGFEKIVAKVAAVEKRLGIDDLSQYTPKT